MEQIDRRTVELTPTEVEIRERFDELLDEGYGIADAAYRALTEWVQHKRTNAHLDAAFVIYLSEGYVVTDNRSPLRLRLRDTPAPIYAMRFGPDARHHRRGVRS